MKKQLLLLIAACGFLYITLSGNAAGPAHIGNGDKTGRGGPGNSCKNCHTGGGDTTTCSIEVRLKSAGASSTPVAWFVNGETYIVTLTGTNAVLPKFGFQLLAVADSPKGNIQLGTFENLSPFMHKKKVSGVDIVEHSNALDKDGSGKFSISVEWKAPASTGVGSVGFAAIINAVNGTHTESGDKVSEPANLTLQNFTSVETVTNNMHIKAYPNPIIGDYLALDMENVTAGSYTVNAYSVNGAHVYHNELSLNSGKATQAINTERWAAGVYVLHIHNGDAQKMITVVKQ